MQKKTMLPRLLYAAGMLLLKCTAALAQPDSTARSVPASALFYASVDIQAIQQFSDHVKDSFLYKALTAGATQKSERGSAETPSQLLSILNQSIAGRVGIAIADEEVKPGKYPSVLVILPVGSNDRAQSLLLKVLSTMSASRKKQQAEQDYHGVTITTFNGDSPKGTPLRFAVLNDCLLIDIGLDIDWLQRAIDANAGRGDSLANEARFTTLQARIGSMGANAAWVWMNTQRVLPRILNTTTGMATTANRPVASNQEIIKPATSGLNREALQALYSAYEGGAFRLVLSSKSVTVDGLFLVNGESEIGKKILAQKGGPLRVASLASSDAILFIGGSNFFSTMDIHRGLLAATDTNGRKIMDGPVGIIEKVSGLNLEKDIFANLGSEFALVLNDVPANLTSIPLLIYMQIKNKEAMEKTLERLNLTLQFVPKDLPQGRIYYQVPKGRPFPIFPGWTFTDDFLVIGTAPDVLETALSLAARQGGPPLAASPAYQRAVADAGDHLVGVFLLNIQKVAALMDRLPIPQPAVKQRQPASNAAGATRDLGMVKAKHVLHALQGLSTVSTVEKDAVTMRMTLSFDLNTIN